MSESDRAYDRLHGLDGHTQADPICPERGIPQSDCPWHCAHGEGGWHCPHEWLDRPESDTRECLICGVDG